MTYKLIFANLKIKIVKISLSGVKGIGQRSLIKGTLNRKVGPGRPRTSTTKHDHRLKMAVLKVEENVCWAQQKETLFLDKQNPEEWKKWDFYQKYLEKLFSVVNKSFPQDSHFKSIVLLCCGSFGKIRTNFPVQCAFDYKSLSNSLHSWKRCFRLFYFKTLLVSHIFL